MKTFATAAEALEDKTPGSRRLKCTLAEAAKLAGLETVDVEGRQAWYTTPISFEPSQSHTSSQEIWIVAVSCNQEANLKSVRGYLT